MKYACYIHPRREGHCLTGIEVASGVWSGHRHRKGTSCEPRLPSAVPAFSGRKLVTTPGRWSLVGSLRLTFAFLKNQDDVGLGCHGTDCICLLLCSHTKHNLLCTLYTCKPNLAWWCVGMRRVYTRSAPPCSATCKLGLAEKRDRRQQVATRETYGAVRPSTVRRLGLAHRVAPLETTSAVRYVAAPHDACRQRWVTPVVNGAVQSGT